MVTPGNHPAYSAQGAVFASFSLFLYSLPILTQRCSLPTVYTSDNTIAIMPEQLNDVPIVTPSNNTGNGDRIVLRTLEKCFFARASEVIARTTVATKGADGKITWFTLERGFHHQLVTTAFAVCKREALIAIN